MFGFLRPHHPEASPAAKTAQWPPGTLVSKEDIYRENKGMAPILLLRKGFEVSPDELPRFIRNGARPHQFLFKPSESRGVELLNPPEPLPYQVRDIHRQTMREDFDGGSYQALEADPRTKKRVLILEPDQKSLKRLIDCLFICGTPLDKIHTVRLPEQLGWAIDKYQPQLLVVDYTLSNEQTGLQVLAGLSSLHSIQKVVFTLNPDAPLSERDRQTLETACPGQSVKLLKKPVSRFTVNRILVE